MIKIAAIATLNQDATLTFDIHLAALDAAGQSAFLTALDEDGDGLTNAQEYLAGTDPRDAASCLRLVDLGPVASNGWRMSFSAVAGRTYVVEMCDSIGSGIWKRLAEFPSSPTNRMVELFDAGFSNTNAARLYRVVTPRLP